MTAVHRKPGARRLPTPGWTGRSYAGALALVAASLWSCRLEPDYATRTDTGTSTDAGASWTDGSGAEPTRCVVVATSEFRAGGSVTTIDADSLQVWRDLTATHQDATLAVRGTRVFVLNREGADNIQELDPQDGFRTLWQHSVGNDTNPWDLQLLDDGHAWVTLYNAGALQLVDTASPSGDAFLVGTPVTLPAWTDDDARVEPAGAVLWNGVLLVLVQGLDHYPNCADGSRGYVHAFDQWSMEPVALFGGQSYLELERCNPTSFKLREDGMLVVGMAGMYRSQLRGGTATDDGGVELVDLNTGHSLGLVLDEAGAGNRDIAAVAMAPDGRMWAALADDTFGADIVELTLQSDGQLRAGEVLWRSEEGGVFALEYRWDRLWVADRSPSRPGLVVLDPETAAVVGGGPLDTGFPPYDIDFVELPAGMACGR